MINMIQVSSSNIAAVGYDEASQTLYGQFRHGGTYAYSSVPNSVYIGLMSANSKGEYHRANIKNSFAYQRIGYCLSLMTGFICGSSPAMPI